MKRIISNAIIVFLLAYAFIACTDNNEDHIPNPPSKGQEQLNEVIKELEKQNLLSEFTNTLKNLEDIKINEAQLTIFAVKNKMETKTASYSTSLNFTENVVKRHIAKGSYNLKNLDLSKSLVILSITNDTLIISKKDNIYFVNGVAIDSSREPIKAGNSYIYMVDEIIPEAGNIPNKQDYKVNFNVLECTTSWSSENHQPTLVSENATIVILEKKEDTYLLVDSLLTTADGSISYTHDGSKKLYYTIHKGHQELLWDGFSVMGTFTSDEDVHQAVNSIYSRDAIDAMPPYVGGMRLADINGDGKINSFDKVATNIFPITYDAENAYMITIQKCLTPNINWLPELARTQNTITSNILLSIGYYNSIDNYVANRYVGSVPDYPSLSKTKEKSNSLIGNALSVIDKFRSSNELFNSKGCPPSITDEWQRLSLRTNLEVILLYSMIYNFYGERPIHGDERLTYETTYEYLLRQLDKLEITHDRNVAKALKARIVLINKDWAKAAYYAKEIIDSRRYQLSANNTDSFTEVDGVDVILGGYPSYEVPKGRYTHAIRYPEILLIFAEACTELGQFNEAIDYINQLQDYVNQPPVLYSATKEEARAAIRELWTLIYDKEGFSFSNLKRWEIFESTLGSIGAKAYNKQLPVPDQIINKYNWTQSAGY